MPNRRRILMLVENVPAPSDARIWFQATALRDHGCQVSIICPKGRLSHRESYVCIDGIHIYRYQLPAGGSFAGFIFEYLVALLKAFGLTLKVWRERGFDVLHVSNPPDLFFLIGLLYRCFGRSFVFDQRDLAPELFRVLFRSRMAHPVYAVMVFLQSCSYRAANMVFVTNNTQKRIAIQRGSCAIEKLALIPNWPVIDRSLPTSHERDTAFAHRFHLAYVGIMGVQDGVEYALRAVDYLVHEHRRRDISLALIGDGIQAPALRALTQQLHLEEYVQFTGWLPRSEVMSYLAVSDIGLAPDPKNGFNELCSTVKVLEYMAMGKPVVAFDLTETRVSAGPAALYATPNNVEDFAAKIELLLDNAALRRQMGDIGRRRIEEELSWAHARGQLLLAYEKLLGASRDNNSFDLVDLLTG